MHKNGTTSPSAMYTGVPMNGSEKPSIGKSRPMMER